MQLFWQRKLTRLELALYAAIVAIAVAVFFERLLYYMEIAERTAMEVTVSRVNSAIHLARAYVMLKGEAPGQALPTADPFQLAGISPRNFLGALEKPTLASMDRGVWLFDRSTGEAIYLPRLYRQLTTNDQDQAIRFRLMPPPAGVVPVLVPTSPYTWGSSIP